MQCILFEQKPNAFVYYHLISLMWILASVNNKNLTEYYLLKSCWKNEIPTIRDTPGELSACTRSVVRYTASWEGDAMVNGVKYKTVENVDLLFWNLSRLNNYWHYTGFSKKMISKNWTWNLCIKEFQELIPCMTKIKTNL